jgi:hypothetical protein
LPFPKHQQGYLDLIFSALEINQSVETFRISGYSPIELDLRNSETLRFLEKNSSIRILDFSCITFQTSEMKIFNESLMKNKTITNLGLNFSNYCGPFDFLQNNILKLFTFSNIWNVLEEENAKNLFDNLKLNHSLTDLNFSYELNSMIQEFIDLMSEFTGNIEKLEISNVLNTEEVYDFNKLLKNQKIKVLDLTQSFHPERLVDFLNKLSYNNTITRLILDENNMENYTDDDIKISNSSIESFYFSGK